MTVALETLDGLKRQLTIEVPAAKVDALVNQKISNFAKTAKIDGFRPGKVPSHVLMKRYGESARQDALGDILNETYIDTLKAENINPAGMPKIDVKQYESGKPLIYTATFEVFPTIKLTELGNKSIEQYQSTLTEKEIEDALVRMQQQRADWKEVDRPAKLNDRVTVDFEGFIDDKPFDGGKMDAYSLTLGSHSMIPGFEEGIVGIKKNEVRDIKVTFPAEYHAENLKGKPAVFKIKAHKIEEPILPAMDDQFAEKYFGLKEDGMKKLKEKVKSHMENELKNALKMKNKNVVMDKLLELNVFDIPEAMIDEEAERMARQAAARFGDAKKTQKIPKELFVKEAKRRVQLGLILAEVVKKHDIKPDDARIKDIVKEVVADYEKPDEILKWYFEDRKRIAEFEMVDIENQVVEKMLANSKITQKTISFNELTAQD
jgi:trigger factor